MKNHEIDYDIAFDFAQKNFPNITLIQDFKDQEKKGSYDPRTHQITIYEKSSHTIFHEVGHYLTITLLTIAGDIQKDYAKNEVLAEISAYLLMKSFDGHINFNFAYSNCWSNRIKDTFEIDEFETDFKSITQYLAKFQKIQDSKKEGEQSE